MKLCVSLFLVLCCSIFSLAQNPANGPVDPIAPPATAVTDSRGVASDGNQFICCHASDDEDKLLYIPPDLAIACNFNQYTRNQMVSPEYTGYAWSINNCQSGLTTAVCAGGRFGVVDPPFGFCDDDDDDIFVGDDGDDDGWQSGPMNTPITTFTDADSARCGTSFSVRRTWSLNCNTANGGADITGDQIIWIDDNHAPMLSAPRNLVIECPPVQYTIADDFNNLFGSANAFDLCDTTINALSIAATVPSITPTAITREFSVTDGCNPITRTQIITIQDTLPPIIETPLNTVYYTCQNLAACVCDVVPSVPAPTAADTCFNSGAVVPTTNDADALEIFPGICAGTYTAVRTWTATDAAGNSVTELQYFESEDITPPVVAPAPRVDFYQQVFCPDDVVPIAYTQTDCSGVISTDVPYRVEYSTLEDEQVRDVIFTYTSEDLCGNTFTWKETYQFDTNPAPLDTFVVSFAPTSPMVATKGTPFTITLTLTPRVPVLLCPQQGVLFIDTGIAELVSAGSSATLHQAATGIVSTPLIFTQTGAFTDAMTIVLSLTVPSDFIGTTVLVGFTLRHSPWVPSVTLGNFLVNFA